RRPLAQQQSGDQKTRDDEEDIDPDVAASRSRHARVIGEHEPHRDRPEALDVWTETLGAGGMTCALGTAHGSQARHSYPGEGVTRAPIIFGLDAVARTGRTA